MEERDEICAPSAGFLNRLDDVVVFHRLDREHIKSIVDLQLNDFGSDSRCVT